MTTVKGLDELRDKLTDMERKVAGKITRRGLRAGAKVTLATAKSEAPKESGETERNLKVRAGKREKDKISVLVGMSQKWFTGPVFYAAFVLFGRKIGSRRLGDNRKMQPANNWLKRAYDATKTSALNTAIDATWEAYRNEL